MRRGHVPAGLPSATSPNHHPTCSRSHSRSMARFSWRLASASAATRSRSAASSASHWSRCASVRASAPPRAASASAHAAACAARTASALAAARRWPRVAALAGSVASFSGWGVPSVLFEGA